MATLEISNPYEMPQALLLYRYVYLCCGFKTLNLSPPSLRTLESAVLATMAGRLPPIEPGWLMTSSLFSMQGQNVVAREVFKGQDDRGPIWLVLSDWYPEAVKYDEALFGITAFHIAKQIIYDYTHEQADVRYDLDDLLIKVVGSDEGMFRILDILMKKFGHKFLSLTERNDLEKYPVRRDTFSLRHLVRLLNRILVAPVEVGVAAP